MKFSLFAILPAVGFFTAAAAGPVAVQNAIEKRAADPVVILQTLFTDVQKHTAIINQTVAGGQSLSSDLVVGNEVENIVAIVNQATTKIQQLAKRDGSLATRQVDPTVVVGLLGSLFSEISGTVSNAGVSDASVGSLTSLLNPLGTSLSNLLLALEQVVDNLLALVKQLLDGVLTGLANALGGFNLGL